MEQPPAHPVTARIAYLVGGAVAIFGFFIFLHGGLSLLGGFGLQRYMMREQGIEPPSTTWMAVECAVGALVLGWGLFLYWRGKKALPQHHTQTKPEPRWQAILKWVILFAIIYYMIFLDGISGSG